MKRLLLILASLSSQAATIYPSYEICNKLPSMCAYLDKAAWNIWIIPEKQDSTSYKYVITYKKDGVSKIKSGYGDIQNRLGFQVVILEENITDVTLTVVELKENASELRSNPNDR